jgi:hypothetical protein
MQSDGNLVIYNSNKKAIWATGTQANPGSYAIVQDDSNFVVYKPSPIWSKNRK